MNISELLDKFKIPIGVGLVGLVLIIGGFLTTQNSKRSEQFPKESLVSNQKVVVVDVSGAVKAPGVYKLVNDARVEDAIKAAGGLSDKADLDYLAKKVNMAQKVSDGIKIYLPEVGEVAGVSMMSQGVVNINSASQSELEALPGIGPVTAAKIISGRPFSKTDDLLNQKIVPKATFDKIKDQISL